MIKPTGIVRKVDPIGRIAIPKTLRKIINIDNEDQVEIYLEANLIHIKRYEKSCIFCGRSGKTTKFMQKCVCPECKKNILMI